MSDVPLREQTTFSHRPRVTRTGERRPWAVAYITADGRAVARTYHRDHATALRWANRAGRRHLRRLRTQRDYALVGPKGATP